MSSRIRINRLPLQNAARAIRAVSSGTGSIGDGRIDIASLLQGVPRLNTPISPNDQQYKVWEVVECTPAIWRFSTSRTPLPARSYPASHSHPRLICVQVLRQQKSPRLSQKKPKGNALMS